MSKEKRKEEIEAFFEDVASSPGVKEIAEVYDRYEELIYISSTYLRHTQIKPKYSVSDNTQE